MSSDHLDPGESPEELIAGICSNAPSGGPTVKPEQLQAFASAKWTDTNVLNIHFLDGNDEWGKAVKAKVAQFIRAWELYGNMQFTFDGSKKPDVLIQLEPTSEHGYGVYQSYLGPYCRTVAHQGKPSMWLIFSPGTPDDELRRVILHEFGHTLGFIHEQKRPAAGIVWNEDKVYEFYAYTGWSKAMIKQQVMDPFTGPAVDRSPFDPASIMIYPIPAGLANVVVGWTKDLSAMDKAFIARLYPFPAAVLGETSLKPDGQPVDGEIKEDGQVAPYRFKVTDPGIYSIETEGPTPLLIAVYGFKDSDTLFQPPVASQGANAKVTAELEARAYTVEVRHQTPRQGTGKFRISVRKQ